MSQMIRKLVILSAVFAAALIVYIVMNQRGLQTGDTVYTAMEEETLPVVSVSMYGREMNPMYGYCRDMGNVAARESLTVLPRDRQLQIRVSGGSESVLGICYEIRSLDLERLVERTTLENWEQQESGVLAVLLIQNLLTPEREYLLCLELTTERHGVVRYYTRIVWTESENAAEMIELAVSFSAKTFDYEQARELVTYLETDEREDNSSFGRTTIRSSFSQLTWGRLGMRPVGEVQVTLRELDGVMGCVTLSYLAERVTGSSPVSYEVSESFTMKWNSVRIYLMDYERSVNQVPDWERDNYSGRRIMLGITDGEGISTEKSSNGQVIAYRVNRDLWSYDQQSRSAVRVFSFRDEEDEAVAPENIRREHDVRILKVEDGGDIDFLVYGYQNRGSREGEFGVVCYHYDSRQNVLNERFFIPARSSFEQLDSDMELLSRQSGNDMFYLFLGHTIYGVDLTSDESMVVADALEDGSFAVSADQSRIAWQEGGGRFDSDVIHLMDLESGEKKDIRGEDGDYVRALGFVGRDLVYGMAKSDAAWIRNGCVVDLPMYAVEIMNENMEVETRYEHSGYLISGVAVDESRIHLKRVVKTGEHSYAESQEDTIVCNADVGEEELEGIGWYASQDEGKLYFVQLDQEIRAGSSLSVRSPRRISGDEAGVLELISGYPSQGMRFYAYGGGKMLGSFAEFSEALKLAYSRMGIVVDRDQNLLWSRVNRPDTAMIHDSARAIDALERHLEEFSGSRVYPDGVTMLAVEDVDVAQLLYFIGRGEPVLAYTGEDSYQMLIGYDLYNVTIYDPSSGENFKLGLNDATEYFRGFGNSYVCILNAE
ncbi:MAG: hypothetical protein LUC99_01180 [Clostridiales bacterium]|nr:hypothetical protein [Clostridiales bacterium]